MLSVEGTRVVCIMSAFCANVLAGKGPQSSAGPSLLLDKTARQVLLFLLFWGGMLVPLFHDTYFSLTCGIRQKRWVPKSMAIGPADKNQCRFTDCMETIALSLNQPAGWGDGCLCAGALKYFLHVFLFSVISLICRYNMFKGVCSINHMSSSSS